MRLLLTLSIIFSFLTATYTQNYPPTNAGTYNLDPGFTYEEPHCRDIVPPLPHYFLQNDSMYVTITVEDNNNNSNGGIHSGITSDIVHKNGAIENLDWAQFIISETMHANWNLANNNPQLAAISVGPDGNSIIASGAAPAFPNLQITATYKIFEDVPLIKISIDALNTSIDATFSGYMQYQIDPDGSNQDSWAEGLGKNFGFATGGWVNNYLHTGRVDDNFADIPTHAIAWFNSEPSGLVGLNYINGVWFPISAAPGAIASFEFYVVTDVPRASRNYPKAQEACEQWIRQIPQIDPELVDTLRKISGIVENIDGMPLSKGLVTVKNIQAETVATVATGTQGQYSAIVPKDVYTLTVTHLNYESSSRSLDASVDSVVNFTASEGFGLEPASARASTGKPFTADYLVSTGEQDIILENRYIAMGIAVNSQDAQVPMASKGIPLDLVVDGVYIDYLDWWEVNKISIPLETLEDWWSEWHIYNDTVYIENDGIGTDSASVVALGRYYREDTGNPPTGNESIETVNGNTVIFNNDFSTLTRYTIFPDEHFVHIGTEISNASLVSQQFYVGDILDMDGSGQLTFLPGYGHVEGTGANDAEYRFDITDPWYGQYVSGKPVMSMIYEGEYADSAVAYATDRWVSLQDRINVPAGETYTLNRKVCTQSSDSFPTQKDALVDCYNKHLLSKTKVDFELDYTTDIIAVGDSFLITLTLINNSDVVVDSMKASVRLGGNLKFLNNVVSNYFPSTLAGEKSMIQFYLEGLAGGRTTNFVELEDLKENRFIYTFPSSVTGPGWYAGDNHSHSIHSDGIGTIAENAASAYSKGMSFLTATDHNTISQRSDVDIQNLLYPDMIVMTGEEITTSRGHALAYNIKDLMPWQIGQYTSQEIIDSVNNHFTEFGKAMFYVAHPNYPGLPYQDVNTITGHAGIEVWNGFYHATHSVNTVAFGYWDEGLKKGMRLLGISNSDGHNPGKVGDNFIVAYLQDLTKEEIIGALRDHGNYYGSNGPQLNFTIDGAVMGDTAYTPAEGRTLNITIFANSNSSGININAIRIIKNGDVVASFNPNTLIYDQTISSISAVPGDYLRMEMEAGNGFAYSNPIWIEEGSSESNIINVAVDSTNFEQFVSHVFNYNYEDTLFKNPTVSAKASHPKAKVIINQVEDVFSSDSLKRTATLYCVSQNIVDTSVYTIEFIGKRPKNKDAGVLSVIINSEPYLAFKDTVFNYIYPDTLNETPTIEVIPVDSTANIKIVLPFDIFSEILTERTGVITVTSEDSSNSNVYQIEFIGISDTSTSIINFEFAEIEFSIYPNPAGDKLTVASSRRTSINYRIISTGDARTVQQGTLSNNIESVDLSKLQSGLYAISFDYEGKTKTIQFIKYK